MARRLCLAAIDSSELRNSSKKGYLKRVVGFDGPTGSRAGSVGIGGRGGAGRPSPALRRAQENGHRTQNRRLIVSSSEKVDERGALCNSKGMKRDNYLPGCDWTIRPRLLEIIHT